jgi:hypothetical protein
VNGFELSQDGIGWHIVPQQPLLRSQLIVCRQLMPTTIVFPNV